MKNTMPQINPSSRYELREAAKFLGVSPSTITRWTNRGLVRCYYRRINHRRVWLGEDLLRIWRSVY